MRVLVNIPSLNKPGGVANYYRTLRSYLPDEIVYYTIGSQKNNEGLWGIIMRSLRDYREYFRTLRKGKYDLVHLNPSLVPKAIVRDAIFLLIAKALKLKVVVFMRGWDVETERIIRKYFMALFRYAFLKADAFVVLGTEFRDKLFDMGFANHVFLETTVVDDRIYSYSGRGNQQTGKESGKTGINILMLTRIEKAKGVYEGIDTYKLLKEKYPVITLTIAGDGRELQDIKQYAESNGIRDVAFPGYVSDDLKRETFEDADIYFFPTTYAEGMPNAVLEAMAYGIPVVTRPVGGVRDFFQNGKMGFITESTDPEEYALLIEDLIKDSELRIKMGLFNRKYAQENFMASSVAARLQEIYRKVLNESATH